MYQEINIKNRTILFIKRRGKKKEEKSGNPIRIKLLIVSQSHSEIHAENANNQQCQKSE